MEVLPSKEQVLEACRAVPRTTHPVLDAAHQLAGLHRQRLRAVPGRTGEIDQHRARLVLTIDQWVAAEAPVPHGGAHLHTETVGTVIDRIAQFSTHAYEIMLSAPNRAVHDAWERLAELALGYQDLADDVSTGHRRLPDLGTPRNYPTGG
ncbi:DUF4254 domain-containing protein [Nocardia sp. NPDC052566]|uniref:DUF4254 domain-containing protein n=1 Tax=Nocardia sp. NPDC052566 TaxID=3364330 RepID=UPI0037C62FB2